MSERNIYKDMMDVLEKHAALEDVKHEYVNPNFLSEVAGLIEVYGHMDSSVKVDKYIRYMWGA